MLRRDRSRCKVAFNFGSAVSAVACVLMMSSGIAVAQDEEVEDEPKKRPKWFVSSLLTNSIFQSFFNTSLAELNVGHRLGRSSAVQLGFAFGESDEEGAGSRVAASSPDDQRPDDIDDLERESSKAISIGYFHDIGKYRSTGLKAGLLLLAGARETRDETLTKTHAENNPADYSLTRTSATTERSYTALILRTEVEHAFTSAIAVGIIQDFFYELYSEKTEEITLSRAYSGGVQTAADDPTKSNLDSDGYDYGTSFKGIYLRIYF